MTTAYATYAKQTKTTPQTKKARVDQVENNAGGYVFQVNDWERLNRFLILGTEGGSYYASQSKLTEENAQHILGLIKKDGVRVVNTLTQISDEGRAPKNDPALFVLALCLVNGDEATKAAASKATPKVARIGTHLFQLAGFVSNLGGWGKGKRKALAKFYTTKTPEKLAYDLIKYQQRGGFSHKDVVNLVHPWAAYHGAGGDNELYRYLTKGILPENALIKAFESLKESKNKKEALGYIKDLNFPREALPTELLTDKDVWVAMLEKMPMTALLRNLPTMTRLGVFDDVKQLNVAIDKLTNEESLKKARIHPLAILVASKVYASNGSIGKSQHVWLANKRILDALNEAFYDSFNYIEPTGKTFMLGCDVSSSMGCNVAGSEFVTCCEAGAVLAMTVARTEKNYYCKAFSTSFVNFDITPKMSLEEVTKKARGMNFGGTNCALPMQEALAKKIDVDTFVVYTDSETWAGGSHPFQALQEYRKKMNKPNAQLIVVGLASNGFTIADPNDRNMLDICGFDPVIPKVIGEFAKGNL